MMMFVITSVSEGWTDEEDSNTTNFYNDVVAKVNDKAVKIIYYKHRIILLSLSDFKDRFATF